MPQPQQPLLQVSRHFYSYFFFFSRDRRAWKVKRNNADVLRAGIPAVDIVAADRQEPTEFLHVDQRYLVGRGKLQFRQVSNPDAFSSVARAALRRAALHCIAPRRRCVSPDRSLIKKTSESL